MTYYEENPNLDRSANMLQALTRAEEAACEGVAEDDYQERKWRRDTVNHHLLGYLIGELAKDPEGVEVLERALAGGVRVAR